MRWGLGIFPASQAPFEPKREQRVGLNLGNILRAALVVLAVVGLVAIPPAHRAVSLTSAPTGFGTAIAYGLGGARELDELGSLWYMDYDYRDVTFDRHPRFFLVKTNWDLTGIGDVARRNRGQWWQFGNEPNDPYQDNVTPAEYAQRYHAFYLALKSADPNARVVPAGLANADWRWADSFRQSYRRRFGSFPRVDGWNIHNYLLDTCEGAADINLFQSRILAFREWMERIGEASKPLFLTEYGVLYGSGCCNCPIIPSDVVVEFMRASSTWLQERSGVQAWAWFALRTDGRYNGDLSIGDSTLTEFGRTYRELASTFNKAR